MSKLYTISDEVLATITSEDDVIRLSTHNKDVNYGYVKYRANWFKTRLETELPDFTLEDIIKIERNWSILKDMLGWALKNEILPLLEYQNYIKNKKD